MVGGGIGVLELVHLVVKGEVVAAGGGGGGGSGCGVEVTVPRGCQGTAAGAKWLCKMFMDAYHHMRLGVMGGR